MAAWSRLDMLQHLPFVRSLRRPRLAGTGQPQLSVCFVNFTGLRANWGCQTTSFELLKLIDRCIGDDVSPRYSFVPLLGQARLELDLDQRLPEIFAAFESVATNAPDRAAALALLEDICLARFGEWVDPVRTADLVVFQAEGTMSGRYEFRTGPGVFLLPFVAKHAWGRRVVSLNQTLFSTRPEMTAMIRHAVAAFDFIAVREAHSAAFAREAAIECAYVPDAAFLTRPCPDARLPALPHGESYFCVTGSALKEARGSLYIFELADEIRAATGLKPVLAAASDRTLIELAAERWEAGSYKIVPKDVHYPAVASVLERCDFLLGGRYHMAIMAAAVGTPTLILRGNTPKNEGLAAMVRSPFPVRRADDAEAVVADARRLVANLPAERASLREAVAEIVATLHRAQAHLANAIGTDHWPPFEATPPKVPPDISPDYAELAARKEPPKSWPAKDAPVTLEQVLAPLLAGLSGDPERTGRVVERLLSGDPGHRALTRDERKLLKAYAAGAR
jgi:polysaccharide pyruvyl transferase WcaK-like protein